MKKSDIKSGLKKVAEGCICRSCGGSGVFARKIISFDLVEVPCTKCDGGWITVKCNTCKGAKTDSDGKPCKTCKGTGKYTYKPTFKFPEGKPCKFCKGTRKVQRKINVVSEEIKCKTCKGEGIINRDHLFNPLVNVESLNKILDKMVFPHKKKVKKEQPKEEEKAAIINTEISVLQEISA